MTAKKANSNRALTTPSSTLLTEERVAYLTEHWPAGTSRDAIFVELNKRHGLPIPRERIASLAGRLGLTRPEVFNIGLNDPVPIGSVEDLGPPVQMTWAEALGYAVRLGIRFREDVPFSEAIAVINDRRVRDGVPPFNITDRTSSTSRPEPGTQPRKRLLALT